MLMSRLARGDLCRYGSLQLPDSVCDALNVLNVS